MKDATATAARAARLIARAAASGALATSRRAKRGAGQPYVSKVGVALDGDGQPLLLLSTLAAHTQDLLADARCSLLLEAPSHSANPLEAARATLVGRAVRLDGDEAAEAREIYLARQPGAARYAGFGDFSFWRVAVDKVHFVGGFGIAKWAAGQAYLAPCTGLAGARDRLIETLNGTHKETLIQAAGLTKAWFAADVDADGVLLRGPKGRAARLDFASPAKDVRAWRGRFAALSKRAAKGK